MKMINFYIVLFILISITNNSIAQRNSDSSLISQRLTAIFGEEYIVTSLVNVDEEKTIFNLNRAGKINDPYGTLENCNVFTARRKNYEEGKCVLGVFKNSQIIWHSEFIKPDEVNQGHIFATEDITNNGKVEIISNWEFKYGNDIYMNLWIHSWDGNRGELVVDITDQGSSIISHEYKGYVIIDYEGDGIWEIVSYGVDNNLRSIPTVNSWDGIKYTISESIQLDSLEMFFPRNNFSPKVRTIIKEKNNDTLFYQYDIYNDPNSGQSIDIFDVYGGVDSALNVTSPNGWKGDSRRTGILWRDSTNFKGFTLKYKIKPGQSLEGFTYEIGGLPFIAEAYLRGYNYHWLGDYRENTSVKDYLNNSVIVKIVAAKQPPSPFVPSEFLDTLISYADSSYSLGWIENEGILNSLQVKLNNAKKQLEKNKTKQTINLLNAFINEVEAQNGKKLTSEAYALLKYNAEYLIGQLSD